MPYVHIYVAGDAACPFVVALVAASDSWHAAARETYHLFVYAFVTAALNADCQGAVAWHVLPACAAMVKSDPVAMQLLNHLAQLRPAQDACTQAHLVWQLLPCLHAFNTLCVGSAVAGVRHPHDK